MPMTAPTTKTISPSPETVTGGGSVLLELATAERKDASLNKLSKRIRNRRRTITGRLTGRGGKIARGREGPEALAVPRLHLVVIESGRREVVERAAHLVSVHLLHGPIALRVGRIKDEIPCEENKSRSRPHIREATSHETKSFIGHSASDVTDR